MTFRLGRGVVAVWLLAGMCAACGDDSDEEAPLDLPVITPVEAWDSRPTGQVIGRLTLENGCLVIDGHAVFWPKGTTWDGDTESVVSDGQVWATVGEEFDGGGGYYDSPVDYREFLGDEPGEAMEGCLDATGAAGAAFAYK